MDKNQKTIKIAAISKVTEHIQELTQLGYNVILFTDIDDTILSTKIGQTLVEKDVKTLIGNVYYNNPSNLVFLTARDPDYKRNTNHHLNRAKLHSKGKYITYNIICSPYDNGNPTKGESLVSYCKKWISNSNSNNWIIFVDDAPEQISDVEQHINSLDMNYTLFHYVFAQ